MTPAAVLLNRLAAARRAGQSFDAAFEAALLAALTVAPGPEVEDWRLALAETAEEWRAGWERRPLTRAELALRAVADPTDREPVPERPCARSRCRREIPDDRGRVRGGQRVRFCSDRCRRLAYTEREREQRRQLAAA